LLKGMQAQQQKPTQQKEDGHSPQTLRRSQM